MEKIHKQWKIEELSAQENFQKFFVPIEKNYIYLWGTNWRLF